MRSRHNIGVRVVERFASGLGIPLDQRAFEGRFGRAAVELSSETAPSAPTRLEVGVLAPETYMNLSGFSVFQALRDLPVEDPRTDLLVVFDDVDLPFGRLRIRPCGGSGGHRGLAHVIERLESEEFPRLRFGVGRPTDDDRDTVEWVLQAFTSDEEGALRSAIPLAAEAVSAVLADGATSAMNRYNRDSAS